MTYTEAVELLEKHGVHVALGGNGLLLVKQCAQLIKDLEGSPELPLVGRVNVNDIYNGDILIFRDSTHTLADPDLLYQLRKKLLELCPQLDARSIMFLALPGTEEETNVELARFPQRLELTKRILNSFPENERKAFIRQLVGEYPVGTFDPKGP